LLFPFINQMVSALAISITFKVALFLLYCKLLGKGGSTFTLRPRFFRASALSLALTYSVLCPYEIHEAGAPNKIELRPHFLRGR
jgi:hypothetical protein